MKNSTAVGDDREKWWKITGPQMLYEKKKKKKSVLESYTLNQPYGWWLWYPTPGDSAKFTMEGAEQFSFSLC